MVLTPRAENLVQEVRSVLNEIDKMISVEKDFDPRATVRRFKIMMSDYAAFLLISHVLQRLERDAPDITLEINPISKDVRGAIEEGRFDLTLVPAEYASTAHPMMSLLRERWVCAVGKHYRLRHSKISMKEYLRARHLSVQYWDQSMPAIEQWQLKTLGFDRKIVAHFPYFVLLPLLLGETNCVAIVQERLGKAMQRMSPIKLISPPVEMPDLHLVIQWHRRHDNDPAFRWLVEVFKEAASLL